MAPVLLMKLRRLAVAWLRVAIAVQLFMLGCVTPLTLFSLTNAAQFVAVYLAGALAAATPLVLAHGWICRRDPPFLKPGYGIVGIYGPALLALLAIRGDLSWEDVVIFGLVYEFAAIMVTFVYILLWRLGDRWLGEAEQPRVWRRWAAAAALAAALAVYLPFVQRSGDEDSCLDRGGRVLADGVCDGA